MTPEALERLIAGGETLAVEFKGEEEEQLSDRDLVETVVCLASTGGSGGERRRTCAGSPPTRSGTCWLVWLGAVPAGNYSEFPNRSTGRGLQEGSMEWAPRLK